MSVESTRARIAAAVEHVRERKGNYEQTARHFHMTTDVVKRACLAAGVFDFPAVQGARDLEKTVPPVKGISPLGFGRVQRGKLWF